MQVLLVLEEDGTIVLARSDCVEYYCRGCKQLRLWARDGLPQGCTNCQSSDIVVDKLNSPTLSKLRFGK